MSDPNFILLYVESPERSGVFYEKLLGKSPIEAAPTFVMFALDSGVMLGLWIRKNVEPAATEAVGGGELAFAVSDDDTVNDTFAEWKQKGLVIAQEPTQMDFGYTFVALDPDGHRLRVFAPSEE